MKAYHTSMLNRGEAISMNEKVHKKRGSRFRTVTKRGWSNIGINRRNKSHDVPATNTPKSILRKHNHADPLVNISVEPIALQENSASFSNDATMKKVKWDPAVKESNRFSFHRLSKAVIRNLRGFAIGLDNNVQKVRDKMQCGNLAVCAGDGGKNFCEVSRVSFEMNDLIDEDSENMHDNSVVSRGDAERLEQRETNTETDFVEMREEGVGMVTLVYNDLTSSTTNNAKRKLQALDERKHKQFGMKKHTQKMLSM